jgi:hypothetical protein
MLLLPVSENVFKANEASSYAPCVHEFDRISLSDFYLEFEGGKQCPESFCAAFARRPNNTGIVVCSAGRAPTFASPIPIA